MVASILYTKVIAMKLKSVRKLFKNSKYSYAITIPPEIIKALRLRTKQKLIVEGDPDKREILIRDWSPKG